MLFSILSILLTSYENEKVTVVMIFPFKVKAVTFDSVSTTVVQDTLNLLFKVSSVPFFKDVYQMLEALNLTSLFKVQ